MEVVFQQGLELCRRGEYHQGIVLFDKVLKHLPQHEASLYNRAKARAKLTLLDDALKDYNRLVELVPSSADYLSDRGILYFHLNEPDLAIADLDTACFLQPNKAYRYASRAFLKDRIGDLKGALEDYCIAVRFDPEDAISLNNMGLIEEKLGHIDKSKDSFKNADNKIGIDNNSYPTPSVEKSISKKNSEISGEDSSVKDISLLSYSKTIKTLMTSKESRREFRNFIFSVFSTKKK